MARSIGKRNIAKVQQITRDMMKQNPGYIDPDAVINKVPDTMLDIWEGAHTEITSIVMDTVMQEAHR